MLYRQPRLLDQVREVIRTRHYSLRTESAYVGWIKRFIFFHGKRHPLEMGAKEVGQFLSALAVQKQVSAVTQSQALTHLEHVRALHERARAQGFGRVY